MDIISEFLKSLFMSHAVSSANRLLQQPHAASAPAPKTIMHLSQRGLDFIASHEGWRSAAYKDAAGYWTIGYGHKIVSGDGFNPRSVINVEQGMALLRRDVASVEKCLSESVRVPLNQSQYDALVSFVYNIGCGAFKSSTLLRELNAGNYPRAADQFGAWVYAGGRVQTALAQRRASEKQLFLA